MSTAANPTYAPGPANSRTTSMNANHTHADYPNGHHHHNDAGVKKGKQKKATDPSEASKLIAAKISQLELDAAGEKDQEAEIEREVKKANRELNNLTSKMDDLQKIETLQRRVTEHLADMKRLERDNQKNKKRGDVLQKEKDVARTDLGKSNSLREKLEKLCRELQKENNRLKGENKTLQDNEKKSREEWDQKFEEMLWQFQDYQDKKDHPQTVVVNPEIDELFKARFKSLIDQYELRELHFHSLLRTKELEVQYNIARFERERKAAEQEINRAKQLNQQVLTFSKTETELRNQLNIYVEKFKQEMEEMSKKTKRLEKENMALTRKHDVTTKNIFQMAEDQNKRTLEIDDLKKRNDKLRDIIDQMQRQGRGLAQGMAGTVEGEYVEGDLEATESEYEYEEGEDEGSEGEYDEDTEEDVHPEPPRPFGPVPPPPPAMNGMAAANGVH
ncbi:hypothetical protein EYC80_003716 [Monilinia laxa]|uniref:Muscle-derived protein (Neurite-outgrowth-promoting) n=1 Tax=Monilinia laxa TaxID=61186 RepID=A0A5N6KKT3_MONLA|nr:hypothetical protein EYC80_003716 [Monilinia laxa]